MNLVIVESPAKAKTIKKYLGKDFEVLASYGHVRDLVPKEGAVDPEQGFAMNYEIIDRNSKHVKAITDKLKKADALFLATDPDREGEAISWHLYELLKKRRVLKDKPVHRVVFHEITKKAIQEAVEHPRDLSMDLINAQQARRALDYLVGFNLSPLLWKKIRRGLSAGRVQSPALRMIVEREEEIEAFKPREYWTIEADIEKAKQPFTAKLTQLEGEKISQFSIPGEKDATSAEKTLSEAAGGKLVVKKIEKKQRRRNPAPPFITSTLQQEASRKLGFTAKRTMRIAQQLYEGVDIGQGAVGLITYMRTDSVTLANEAIEEIRDHIRETWGKEMHPDKPRSFKTKSKNAQEAHEAIRPTSIRNIPKEIAHALTDEQRKLYELIWKRTIASQMTHATINGTDYYTNTELTWSPDDGKARVWLIWAHWCPYCQAELPDLDGWWIENNSRFPNVELVTITTAIDDTAANPLIPYLDAEQFPFPVVIDESGSMSQMFGTTAFPFWVVTDNTGTVVLRVAGALGIESVDQIFAQLETMSAET